MRSPARSAASARVPEPIASIRNVSCPSGAEQRLIGRGRTWPGGCSMKNWPGIPGSRAPRSSRSSVYGPTASEPATLSDSRRTKSFLKAERVLAARVCDRMHSRRRTRKRGDARDSRDEGSFADAVAVAAGAGALRRVHDEVATAAPDQVDHRRSVAGLGHLANPLNLEPCGGKRERRPTGGQQLE